MASGPILRNTLKRAGLAEYTHYWRFLKDKCDQTFGPRWRASRDGICVDGAVVVPIGKVREFLEGCYAQAALPGAVIAPAVVPSPIAPVLTGLAPEPALEPEPVLPVEPEPPTFECKEKGCSYVGYTRKALEAHCRRTGH